MPDSPLTLQAHPDFNYTFRNIALLHEALTHSFEGTTGSFAYGAVIYRKKSFYRLKTLGISVLKLLLSEQALCENAPDAGPGTLSRARDQFLEEELLTSLGRHLQLHRFIESQLLLFLLEKLYPTVIKSLIGAVFVDSDNDLGVCKGVLHRMYQSARVFTVEGASARFDAWFPRAPCKNVALFLLLKGDVPEDIFTDLEKLYEKVGYEFNTPSYFVEALTHGSCKGYEYLKKVPDFERLEFLGDAVYELVICEYLFWHFVNDDEGTQFNKLELDKYTSAPFQRQLAHFFALEDCILKPGRVQLKRIHEFLESLVGAIYVDSGRCLAAVKEVLLKEVKEQFSLSSRPRYRIQLPYSLATSCTTKYRLANPDTWYQPESALPPSPLITHAYKVPRMSHFVKNWPLLAASEEDHLEQLGRALCEAQGERGKECVPLATANKLEYHRTSMYGVVVENLLKIQDDAVIIWAKIRGFIKGEEVGGEDIFMKYGQKLVQIRLPGLEAPSEEGRVPVRRDIKRWLTSEYVFYIPEGGSPKETPGVPGNEEDWVSLEEARRAVVCLWNFFRGWGRLLGKWMVNKVIALILEFLQMAVFLVLVGVSLNVFFRWRAGDGEASNEIASKEQHQDEDKLELWKRWVSSFIN